MSLAFINKDVVEVWVVCIAAGAIVLFGMTAAIVLLVCKDRKKK